MRTRSGDEIVTLLRLSSRHVTTSPWGPSFPSLQTLVIRPASLPGAQEEIHNMLDALATLHRGKDSRPTLSHPRRISLHDGQVRAHSISQITLIHHQEIRPRDPGPTLPRHLIPPRHIDHIDDKIRQLPRIIRRQIIPPTLDQQQIRREPRLQALQRQQVRRDVLPDRRVRTAARLDGLDPLRRQGPVAGQELGVLAREDVVGHDGDVVLGTQGQAQREHQRRLARPDGPADADREGAVDPVAVFDQGQFAVREGAGPGEGLVRVAVVGGAAGGE